MCMWGAFPPSPLNTVGFHETAGVIICVALTQMRCQECYKTKITSIALAAAVSSWELSQVFVISLSGWWMWDGSKPSPPGVNLATDEETSDQRQTTVQRDSFTIYQCTEFVSLMIIFHRRHVTKLWAVLQGASQSVSLCVALSNTCKSLLCSWQ